MDRDETEWGTVAWGLFCFAFPSSLSQNFSAVEILVLFEAMLSCVSEMWFMCVNTGISELHQCIFNSAELLLSVMRKVPCFLAQSCLEVLFLQYWL